MSEGDDWLLRREALAALLRRIEIARNEKLRVIERPPLGLGDDRTLPALAHSRFA